MMSSLVHAGAVSRRGASEGVPTAMLAEVDILSELATRPRRSPNYEREHRAFDMLSAEMADNPTNMLQRLVEVAVDLCEAHTVGISLLDGSVFRREAVAGVFAGARGGTMPRNESPCGLCVDRDATQLLYLADRYFPALSAEPRFVEALLVPFYDRGRSIGTVWIVSHDFKRKFDREDERLIRVLSRFASAGWQLLKASETAAASSQRKDEFLATLGHELRSPFGAILSAAALLRQIANGDDRVERAIAVITRQTHHISRLMDDLLDIERIENGKLHLEKHTIDLRTIVSETIDTRRSQIERRRHMLTVDLGAQPVLVDADPVRLVQVLSNLIDNATKYTPEHGRISVAVSSDRDEAAIAVSDTGVGVPAERVQSIFEPFTQLTESDGLSAGGLGLGLALVRRLTELHGGSVSAASAGRGQGSCFTVRLPMRPALFAPQCP